MDQDQLGPADDAGPFFIDALEILEGRQHTYLHHHALRIRAEHQARFLEELRELAKIAVRDPKVIAFEVAQLGDEAGAAAIRSRIPENTKTRSGDLGEILAAHYMRTALKADVRYRIRMKENVELPLHGDDAIGIKLGENGRPIMYKAEAKMKDVLGIGLLNEARQNLEKDGGRLKAERVTLLIAHYFNQGDEVIAKALNVELVSRGLAPARHLLMVGYRTASVDCFANFYETLDRQHKTHLVSVHAADSEKLQDIVDAVWDALKING